MGYRVRLDHILLWPWLLCSGADVLQGGLLELQGQNLQPPSHSVLDIHVLSLVGLYQDLCVPSLPKDFCLISFFLSPLQWGRGGVLQLTQL